MNAYRGGWKQLRQSWRPVLIFEAVYKLMTVLILAPACGGLLQLAIRGAHLRYLTNSNLLRFLRSPWTWLVLLLLLGAAALYTLFEIGAVCRCYAQPANQPIRQTLRKMLRGGLSAVKGFFTSGSPLLLLHLLVLIPLMQCSVSSGVFTAMGIPDFISYYMTKKEFLLPLYLAAVALFCLLAVRWIFSTVLFTRNGCSYNSARQCSIQLVRGSFWRTFASLLGWNLCYFAVLACTLLAITLIVLLVFRLFFHRGFIGSRTAEVLRLLIRLVLWGFSFFAVPISMAYVTALLDKRSRQRPDVTLPKACPQKHRTVSPCCRAAAVITALCVTAAALGLQTTYLYTSITGRSALQLTMYRTPAITAHRGCSVSAPENTLYAFADAIEAGADFIELDVQQTKDGILVVLHDQNLKRVTGLDREIWEVTYRELRELDAGSWFDSAYANARIPTLEEVFHFVDGRIRLNIEIKPSAHTTADLEDRLAAQIEQAGCTDSCYVTSFSYSTLKKIKQANPDIRTGYIMSVAYGQFYQLQYADAFSLNKAFVTSQVVSAAHQAGKEVFAWTVNTSSEARSLYQLHVDSIITDDPLMVQETVRQSGTSETLWGIMDYMLN